MVDFGMVKMVKTVNCLMEDLKRLMIILLAAFVLFDANATHRALVIGIGDYPVGSGWAKINGDNDIPMVEDILRSNGFKKQNITCLSNSQATCSAICRQLENLLSAAQTGDYIYIHFSGHGQQITDLNGDEDDGLDEAWIPYDAQFAFRKGKYEGENHLVDDKLNGYLHRLRQKVGDTGKIVVIADACHSGGGSRGDDEYIVRGARDAFVIPPTADHRHTADTPVQKVEWVFLSACKPYQSNYEYNGNGSLTYALYQQRDNFTRLTAKQIRLSVSQCIASIIPYTQNPVLEVSSGGENDIFF